MLKSTFKYSRGKVNVNFLPYLYVVEINVYLLYSFTIKFVLYSNILLNKFLRYKNNGHSKKGLNLPTQQAYSFSFPFKF